MKQQAATEMWTAGDNQAGGALAQWRKTIAWSSSESDSNENRRQGGGVYLNVEMARMCIRVA